MNDTNTQDKITQAFKQGNGRISATELKKVLSSLGENLTEEEVDEMVRDADSDGDGLITQEEFDNMMMTR